MPKILPDKATILSHVDIDPTTGCWLWRGETDDSGYGQIRLKVLRPDGTTPRRRNRYSVHLVAWEVWNGPLEKGLELDHLCRTRRCCRPSLADREALSAVLGWPPTYIDSPTVNPYVYDADYASHFLALGQHLEPVTHKENVRRSNSPPGINSRKETCPEGHPYKERKGQDGHSWRYCPECKNQSRREYAAIRRDLASLGPTPSK